MWETILLKNLQRTLSFNIKYLLYLDHYFHLSAKLLNFHYNHIRNKHSRAQKYYKVFYNKLAIHRTARNENKNVQCFPQTISHIFITRISTRAFYCIRYTGCKMPLFRVRGEGGNYHPLRCVHSCCRNNFKRRGASCVCACLISKYYD